MKWLVWLLAGTTLVSGAAALHYSRAVKQQQALRALPVAAYDTATAERGAQAFDDTSPATTAASTAVVLTATPPAAVGAAQLDPGLIAVARHRLEALRDPQVRARKAAGIASMQQMVLRELAPYLELSSQEVEHLVETSTATHMSMQQKVLECEADPACNAPALETSLVKSAEDDFARRLGAERSAKLQAYNDAADERVNLQIFRDRLPPGTLSASEIQQLSLALAEERRRFVRNADARNQILDEFRAGTMLNFTVRSAAMPGADESGQRLESARIYLERVNERAAGVLNDEPLAAFKASQEKALAAYKTRLTEKDIAAAARARN